MTTHRTSSPSASTRSTYRPVGGRSDADAAPASQFATAEHFIGADIVNPRHETLGKVADLMLDISNGCVAHAVMVVSGFLGLGEKRIAVPWSMLMYDPGHNVFLAEISEVDLKAAPSFAEKDLSSGLGFSALDEKIRSYWHAHGLHA